MPNGTYGKLVEEINARIAADGLNSISDKEMGVLVAAKLEQIAANIDDVSQRTTTLIDSAVLLTTHQHEIYEMLKRPPWRSWQPKDLAVTGVIFLTAIGVIKADQLIGLINSILHMHG